MIYNSGAWVSRLPFALDLVGIATRLQELVRIETRSRLDMADRQGGFLSIMPARWTLSLGATMIWTALTLLGVSMVAPGAASGDELRLTSAERVTTLSRAAELSQLIIIGAIDSKTPTKYQETIWTQYHVTVDSLIKGPPQTPGGITIEAEGGRIGDRIHIVLPEIRYQIGSRYLLFLTKCADNENYRTACPACTARIDDDRAYTRNPGGEVALDALLDSVRGAMQPCEIAKQRETCDLEIIATLASLPSHGQGGNPRLVRDTLGVLVNQVLRKRGGPVVTPGSGLEFAVDKTDIPGTTGTKPAVAEIGVYLLFLRLVDSHWELNRSAYAVWRKVGDDAVVEGRMYPCRVPYIVATESWEALIEE